jgi:hypothetical protein
MNGGLTNFEKHCKRLKIEANDKEDHLIKGIVDKNKSEFTYVSQTRENMSTCLRLFHLNICLHKGSKSQMTSTKFSCHGC